MPQGQKGDYVFGGYMVPGRPDLVQNIPNPVLKAQFDKGNVKVDSIKTEERVITAFDENGDVQTFATEQASDKHMAKPKVQAWYAANDLKPEYKVETTTTTEKNGTRLDKNVKTERVAPLVSAANRVNKEENSYGAFALTPNIINNKEVARPDVSLFSTSDTAGEDLTKFDNALREAGLTTPRSRRKNVRRHGTGGCLLPESSQSSGLHRAKRIVYYRNWRNRHKRHFENESENYLTRFGAIRFLLEFVEALNQATVSSAAGPIRALKERMQDDTGTTDSLVGHYSMSEEQDMARSERRVRKPAVRYVMPPSDIYH